MRTMDAERIVHRLAKNKGMNESFTPFCLFTIEFYSLNGNFAFMSLLLLPM